MTLTYPLVLAIVCIIATVTRSGNRQKIRIFPSNLEPFIYHVIKSIQLESCVRWRWFCRQNHGGSLHSVIVEYLEALSWAFTFLLRHLLLHRCYYVSHCQFLFTSFYHHHVWGTSSSGFFVEESYGSIEGFVEWSSLGLFWCRYPTPSHGQFPCQPRLS